MHAHLVAARQKTQKLMDEIDSLSSSKYGHPDYMTNFGNRVTKIQQAIQVRYVDGLLTRYRGRLLYMPQDLLLNCVLICMTLDCLEHTTQ